MNRIEARDVMTHPVATVHPDTPVTELVHTLRKRGVSGLPVVDKLGRLVGIVTEGDVLRIEARRGNGPLWAGLGAPFAPTEGDDEIVQGKTAEDLMIRSVVTARETTPVREIARMMAREGINRVPIVRHDHVIGIVTRADVIGVFDRPDSKLRADVRRTMLEDLRLDPDRLEITIKDRVVTIRGELDHPAEVKLLEAFVSDIDGVAATDISELKAREPVAS